MRLLKFFSSIDEDFVRQNFKDAGEAGMSIKRNKNLVP